MFVFALCTVQTVDLKKNGQCISQQYNSLRHTNSKHNSIELRFNCQAYIWSVAKKGGF